MNSRDIVNKLETLAPRELAMDWDNVGLLAGLEERDINSVFLALDPTDSVVDKAVECGADMLITHHPLMLAPVGQVIDSHFIGRRMIKLIEGKMNYYAMHTNFDVAVLGGYAAQCLKLEDPKVLQVTKVYSNDNKVNEMGVGMTGKLPRAMTLKDCAELVKAAYHIPSVRIYGASDALVEAVSVSPGSGRSMIGDAIRQHADVLITGDIGHHDGIDAVSRGLFIIDAGHHGIEHIFVEYMEQYFKENFQEIKVYTEENIPPFLVV